MVKDRRSLINYTFSEKKRKDTSVTNIKKLNNVVQDCIILMIIEIIACEIIFLFSTTNFFENVLGMF